MTMTFAQAMAPARKALENFGREMRRQTRNIHHALNIGKFNDTTIIVHTARALNESDMDQVRKAFLLPEGVKISAVAPRPDRVTELLAANNREVTRRRNAEIENAALRAALAPFAEIGRIGLNPPAPLAVLVNGWNGPELMTLDPRTFLVAAAAFEHGEKAS